MTKFYVSVPENPYFMNKYGKEICCNGFAEAEQLTKKIFDEFCAVDAKAGAPGAVVECRKSGEPECFAYVYRLDCLGETTWYAKRYNGYIFICFEPLGDYEEEQIERYRHEGEDSVLDCSFEEFEQLVSEINVGSLYTSDYENTLNFDADEVFEVFDRIDCEIYREGRDFYDVPLREIYEEYFL